jgi:aryl-alcohol dehydrogenase-like predicted oxidoreductase
MSDIVASGRAMYWGTSEWSAEEIREANDVADRRNLRKPQMEQPEYNLFRRRRVESEFARLYAGLGLGLTTFSPLASGVLTGKYNAGIPSGSRLSLPGYEWLKEIAVNEKRIEAVRRLEGIARELGATTAQLALAWCASNPRVSSVITGASGPEQVAANLKAVDLLPRMDEALRRRIEEATSEASDIEA